MIPLLVVPYAKRNKERIAKEKERSGQRSRKCQKELKKNASIVLICIRNPLHSVPNAKNTTERITKEKERLNQIFQMDINIAPVVDSLNI